MDSPPDQQPADLPAQPSGETTESSNDDEVKEGADTDEDPGLPAGQNKSFQQPNNESQDNQSNSEKSTGDCQSPSDPTATLSKNMDSPPDQQPADLPAQPSGEITESSNDDVEPVKEDVGPEKPPYKNSDNNTATPTGETTESSNDDVEPVKEDKADSLQNGEKNSGQEAHDGSQDISSNSDNQSPDGHTDDNTGTPTEKTTVPSIDIVTSVEGGADTDEDPGLPAGQNKSFQQPNNESQDNQSNSEKSTGDCQSPSDPTDVGPEKPPYKNSGEITERSNDDVEPVKEDVGPKKPLDKNSDSRTSAVSQKEPPNEEMEKQKMSKKEDVEVIGPTATQTELSEKTGILGGGMKLFLAVAAVALVAIVAQYCLESKSPPQKTDWQQVDVFLKQMRKVKARFPNQRAELWTRSEIHLKRHLQTSQPAEPVSLILTSGVRAETTMRCLAQDVASAFSTARNASVLHINGAGKAGQDSDQVKLDIDRKLQGAFEGDKPVAVIHRLEELPPGSTLIFYRYCDHENAAYKKTFLIFTVLLGDEEEIPAELRLSIVEEMVDDYLQKRFLSHDHPVSFDRMDLNKYGGLWSRISHLILPVAAEDRIEQEGC